MGLTGEMNERGGGGVYCSKKNSISSSSTGGASRGGGDVGVVEVERGREEEASCGV